LGEKNQAIRVFKKKTPQLATMIKVITMICGELGNAEGNAGKKCCRVTVKCV
jgi:hypothetical protein